MESLWIIKSSTKRTISFKTKVPIKIQRFSEISFFYLLWDV
jgi:hypothetical protein